MIARLMLVEILGNVISLHDWVRGVLVLSLPVLEGVSDWADQRFLVSLLIQHGLLEEVLGLDGAGIILFILVYFQGHFMDWG